jgi:ABC-type nitrate/sulfonate/bicarbonate transport system ATPase subunit
MITLKSVTFGYRAQPLIFDNFDWQVGSGEAWAVLGPSGCGKTTLLYLLAGLRQPDDGQVVVDGQVLDQPRPCTGLILQDYGLLSWATVKENVSLGLRIRKFYGPDGRHAPREDDAPRNIDRQTDYWIERLGLAEITAKFPAQISGGQRQRTAIARTLTLNPDLLLMDEPFASLDAPTRETLQALVFELRAESSLTTIIVTHSIEEAAVLGRHILVLGAPPHTRPVVLDNPEAGSATYRNSPAYTTMCSRLRTLLEPVV